MMTEVQPARLGGAAPERSAANRSRMGQTVRRSLRTLSIAALLVGLGSANALADASETRLWAALQANSAFAIMRHAIAPGFGDPDEFRVDDCSTQRNLSEEGRQQARRIGERFRENGIVEAQVMSSAWCRCRDTAHELDLGSVETLTALNSFFDFPERRTVQTAELQDWLTKWARESLDEAEKPPLVLVTHQVNISALTGRSTRSGEVLVVRRNGPSSLEVIGSILTPVP